MDFNDLEKKYKRLNISGEANLINYYSTRISRSNNIQDKNKFIKEVDIIKRRYYDYTEYVYIKTTQDMNDEFFLQEAKYIQDNEDEFEKACVKFAQTLLDDDDIDELKKRWGKYFFDKLNVMQNLFNKDVIGLNINERKTIEQMNEYRASKSISFNNEKITNKNLHKYVSSQNRDTRKNLFINMNKSNLEYKDYYSEKYRDLIVIRHKIARRLGYDGYLEYSDKDRCRIDYDHNDIINFRKAIKKYLASNIHQITDIQREKLKVDKLYTYDLRVYFKDCKPTPLSDPYLILNKISKRLKNINPILTNIIKKMFTDKSFDLSPRENKANINYASYIINNDISFMFANYERSAKSFMDFTVCLSYALLNYISSYNELIEYTNPQDDIAEAFSIAFNFLIFEFANELFIKDYKKYIISYKIKLLYDILFYCLINEFEESLYLDIKTDVNVRYNIFRKLHHEYFPFISVDENVFDVGMWWLNYYTLFNRPMLSINFALGAFSGIDYCNKLLENKNDAIKSFNTMMDKAGKEDFLKTIVSSNLKNPFDCESVKTVVEKYIKNLKNEYKNIKY